MVEKEHLPWAVRCLDGVRVTAVSLVELAGTEPAQCDPSTPAQDAPLLLVLPCSSGSFSLTNTCLVGEDRHTTWR